MNNKWKAKVKTYRYEIEKTPATETPTTETVTITMKAASAYASEESGNGYKLAADGENTVLTISKSGTYTVSTEGSGSITGQIVNKATDGAVKLVLNGVNLTNANNGDDGVILNKKSASPLQVILASGSTNSLTATGDGVTETKSDGTTDTDYPAGIMVKKGSALTIGGTGTLNITATHGSGIKVKYNDTENDISTSCVNDSKFWATTLTIQDNPTINITCNADDETAYKKNNYNTENYEAHQDGISSKNSLAIYGGNITIAAGDDGIHAEATAQIVAGTIKVSSSTEALEGARVIIDGGTVDLKAYDDGINAANGDLTTNSTGEDTGIFSITINGGTVTVDAEGDGLDSNGNAYITGGDVRVYGPSTGGNGALDVADQGGAAGVLKVTGGTLYATAASSDMAVAPSGGGYTSVVFTLTGGGPGIGGMPGGNMPGGNMAGNNGATTSGTTIAAGTTLTIKDAGGTTVGTLTTQKTTGWVLYCGGNLTEGQTYTLYNGTTQVATATAGAQTGNSGGGMTPPNGTNPGGMTPPDGSNPGGMTPPNGGTSGESGN